MLIIIKNLKKVIVAMKHFQSQKINEFLFLCSYYIFFHLYYFNFYINKK